MHVRVAILEAVNQKDSAIGQNSVLGSHFTREEILVGSWCLLGPCQYGKR